MVVMATWQHSVTLQLITFVLFPGPEKIIQPTTVGYRNDRDRQFLIPKIDPAQNQNMLVVLVIYFFILNAF